MGEGQMKKLKNLEERTETIHKPMLILLGDSSLFTTYIKSAKYLLQGLCSLILLQ